MAQVKIIIFPIKYDENTQIALSKMNSEMLTNYSHDLHSLKPFDMHHFWFIIASVEAEAEGEISRGRTYVTTTC